MRERVGPAVEDLVRRLVVERVEIAPYDAAWPARFDDEERRLRATLPADVVGRIEHFGSTAVPGLDAKPIVDVLVEVASTEDARTRVVPILRAQGCDLLFRPTSGDDVPPWYWWAIRRDAAGRRTHHLHLVEPDDDEHWSRLRFRDLLRADPELAGRYAALKRRLAADGLDRVAYTVAKTAFIQDAMGRGGASR